MQLYVSNVISKAEKEAYIQVAQVAIDCLKKKITELQQMVANNVAMPTMNQPHQVPFYIKDAIGIPNRASQSGLTSGATNESDYIRFIPIRLTELDLHRIIKESVNRVLVKEIDTNEEYYETKRSKLINFVTWRYLYKKKLKMPDNKVTAYIKQIETMLDQFRNEFGDESIEDDEYLTDLDGFVSRLR